jgi:hypothetical protein
MMKTANLKKISMLASAEQMMHLAKLHFINKKLYFSYGYHSL